MLISLKPDKSLVWLYRALKKCMISNNNGFHFDSQLFELFQISKQDIFCCHIWALLKRLNSFAWFNWIESAVLWLWRSFYPVRSMPFFLFIIKSNIFWGGDSLILSITEIPTLLLLSQTHIRMFIPDLICSFYFVAQCGNGSTQHQLESVMMEITWCYRMQWQVSSLITTLKM